MSTEPQPDTKQPNRTSIGIGIYIGLGPIVVLIAGIGGKFGERWGGGAGYWAGVYLAGVVAAVLAGLLFARLLSGHPLYWIAGALGMLLGGHLTWFALGGRPGQAPLSGFDQVVSWSAALIGMYLGFLIAHRFVASRIAKAA